MDINETSHDKVTAAIEGMFRNAYECLILGQEDRYAGYKLMARQVWNVYQSKMTKDSLPRVGLSPLEDMDREMLNRFLDPAEGVALGGACDAAHQTGPAARSRRARSDHERSSRQAV